MYRNIDYDHKLWQRNIDIICKFSFLYKYVKTRSNERIFTIKRSMRAAVSLSIARKGFNSCEQTGVYTQSTGRYATASLFRYKRACTRNANKRNDALEFIGAAHKRQLQCAGFYSPSMGEKCPYQTRVNSMFHAKSVRVCYIDCSRESCNFVVTYIVRKNVSVVKTISVV